MSGDSLLWFFFDYDRQTFSSGYLFNEVFVFHFLRADFLSSQKSYHRENQRIF